MEDVFQRARDVKTGLDMAEANRVKAAGKKCDWKRGEDRALLESIENAREGLRMRPKDGLCPNCSLFAERWVYEPVVMCWGCYRVGGGAMGQPSVLLVGREVDGRVEVDGGLVLAARLRRCWSRRVLGVKIGVSQQYVDEIESRRGWVRKELVDRLVEELGKTA